MGEHDSFDIVSADARLARLMLLLVASIKNEDRPWTK
jgi:hypothetical protein